MYWNRICGVCAVACRYLAACIRLLSTGRPEQHPLDHFSVVSHLTGDWQQLKFLLKMPEWITRSAACFPALFSFFFFPNKSVLVFKKGLIKWRILRTWRRCLEARSSTSHVMFDGFSCWSFESEIHINVWTGRLKHNYECASFSLVFFFFCFMKRAPVPYSLQTEDWTGWLTAPTKLLQKKTFIGLSC